MFGASGILERPSRPWQVWHASAFCRPALTLPAATAAVVANIEIATMMPSAQACSLPLKRGGLGWGSQCERSTSTPTLSLPLSGGGDARARAAIMPKNGARCLSPIIPDAIQRPGEIVRHQDRSVGQLRDIDRPAEILAVLGEPAFGEGFRLVRRAVLLEAREHHACADRRRAIP